MGFLSLLRSDGKTRHPSIYIRMRQPLSVLVHTSMADGFKVDGQMMFCVSHHLLPFLIFFPLVIAVLCWARHSAYRRVHFHTDNMSVMHIVNSQSSRCPRVMHLVRLFVLECLRYNISFRAVHVPGASNEIADALSRFQAHHFREVAPHAEAQMTPLPAVPLTW